MYCNLESVWRPATKQNPPHFLARNFVVADRIRRIVKQAIHRWRHPAYTMSPERNRTWTLPGYDEPMLPLGVEGGIARCLKNMQKLADLLVEHNIPLRIVVYPWANQLFYGDRESRLIAIWRAFCVKNCREFIDLFPAFFAEKDVHKDWYQRLFIYGDEHYSAGGHRLMFRELAKHLL